MIERWLRPADDEIDRMVYDLHGLAEDEIGIVEEQGSGNRVLRGQPEGNA